MAVAVELNTQDRTAGTERGVFYSEDMGLFHMTGEAVEEQHQRPLRAARPVKFKMQPPVIVIQKHSAPPFFLSIPQKRRVYNPGRGKSLTNCAGFVKLIAELERSLVACVLTKQIISAS